MVDLLGQVNDGGHEGEDKNQVCDISGDCFINIDVEIIIFITHLTISRRCDHY